MTKELQIWRCNRLYSEPEMIKTRTLTMTYVKLGTHLSVDFLAQHPVGYWCTILVSFQTCLHVADSSALSITVCCLSQLKTRLAAVSTSISLEILKKLHLVYVYYSSLILRRSLEISHDNMSSCSAIQKSHCVPIYGWSDIRKAGVFASHH